MSTLFQKRFPVLSLASQSLLLTLDIFSIVASISVLSITPIQNDCPDAPYRPLVTVFLISNALSTLEYFNFEVLKIDEGTNYGKQFLFTRLIFWVNGYLYKILCLYSLYVLWHTPDVCRFYSSEVTVTIQSD
jgi:hypothetical protein